MPEAERASFLQLPNLVQQPSTSQQPSLLLEPDETTGQQVEQQMPAAMPAPPPFQQFGGCDDARAAGRENIMRGDPSYREDMDGDHDGIACEPYRDIGSGGGGRRGRRF